MSKELQQQVIDAERYRKLRIRGFAIYSYMMPVRKVMGKHADEAVDAIELTVEERERYNK